MKKRWLALVMVLLMILSMAMLAVSAQAAESIRFVPVSPYNEYDVQVNGEGPVVTIYCLQQKDLWPYGSENVNYVDHADADNTYPTEDVNLLTPEQIQILKKLVYAGYPNDSQGILRKFGFDLSIEGMDEYAGLMTNVAIWTLMTEWGKAGSNPDQTLAAADEMTLELIEYALSDDASVTRPTTDTIVIEGASTLVKDGGKWSTGEMMITQPAGYNLLFDLKLPSGAYAVDADGYEITAVEENQPFRIIANDAAAAQNITVGAESVASYPSDISFFVTKDPTGVTDPITKEPQTYQTMLYIEKETMPLQGSLNLTTTPLGNISVSKTVTGERADKTKEFNFTVTLSNTALNGQYGNMTFTNGVATFALKDGQTKHAYDLPVGITYTVTEDDYTSEGYTTGAFDATGTIKANETAEASFVNNYQAAAVKVTLSGKKTLTGDIALAAGDYSFQIDGHKEGISKIVTNAQDGTIDFGTHEFTEPGVYEYQIKEIVDGKKGVTYDTKIYHITITVEDDLKGHLSATLSGDTTTGTDINFTNAYQAHSTSVVFGGEKILAGFPNDSEVKPKFTFVLKEGNTELDRQTIEVAGRYEFKSITYTAVGEHHYTVYEEKGNQPGVTYDEGVYDITVDVTDIGGELSAVISGETTTGDDLDFGNSYKAAKAQVTLIGQKRLTGEKALQDKEFSFTIVGHDDDLRKTVQNDANGKIDFGTHEYSAIGTYRYTVKEDVTDEKGITFDNKVYEFTVEVKDDGSGQLKASVTGDITDDNPTLHFTNKYKAHSTAIELGGQKILENFPTDSEVVPQFVFELLDKDEKYLDSDSVSIQGAYAFKSITYTEAGEYDYIVREIQGTQAGIKYDSTQYKVHVSVADAGGELTATVTVDGESGKQMTFTNSYQAAETAIHLTSLKTLEGKPLQNNEFSFTIKGIDDNVDLTVYNDADGKIDFGTHTYTKAGTYRYTLKENNTGEEGVTYDTTIHNIVVSVTDDGHGQLKAEYVEGTQTGSDIHFTNKYQAGSTSVTFGGKKVFSGFPADSKITPEFTFVLKEGDQELERQTVNGQGEYNFGSITYDQAGTHDYTVQEIKGFQNGVTYDSTVYDLHVEVNDVGGKLQATVSGNGGDGTNLDFTNTYEAKAVELHIRGTKILEGKPLEDREFSFTIKGMDDDVDITVSNDASGLIDFGKHAFTKPGKYRYTVKENNTGKSGITYNSTIYDFTITVTDDGSGWLTADVSGNLTSESGVHFTNTYDADATEVILSGRKTLIGKALEADEFFFTLTGNDGTTETVANAADGTYAFTRLTFDKAGEYRYTVREEVSNESGITCDNTVYDIIITVTDNGKGKLIATISGSTQTGADLDFTNQYQAAEVDVFFTGRKTLEGKTLTADEFSFTLADDNGTIETVKNAADGTITFHQITFRKAGVYKYTVREETPNEAGIVPDSKIYNIIVTVTDNGAGQLLATVDGDTKTGNDLNFANKYEAAAVSISFTGRKSLTGTYLEEGEFIFTMKSQDGKKVTVTNAADGKIDFGTQIFTKPGVYKYTFKEEITHKSGITYDETVYNITVTVTDDGSGQLKAVLTGTVPPDKLDFANKYDIIVPKTGDNSHLFTWMLVLCFSGIALISMTLYGKKRKN